MSDILTFRDYDITIERDARERLFKKYCEKCEHCKLGDYSYYCKKEHTTIDNVPPCKKLKVSIEDKNE